MKKLTLDPLNGARRRALAGGPCCRRCGPATRPAATPRRGAAPCSAGRGGRGGPRRDLSRRRGRGGGGARGARRAPASSTKATSCARATSCAEIDAGALRAALARSARAGRGSARRRSGWPSSTLAPPRAARRRADRWPRTTWTRRARDLEIARARVDTAAAEVARLRGAAPQDPDPGPHRRHGHRAPRATPGETRRGRRSVATLADLRRLRIEARSRRGRRGRARCGRRGADPADGFPGRTWAGRVEEIAGLRDPAAR